MYFSYPATLVYFLFCAGWFRSFTTSIESCSLFIVHSSFPRIQVSFLEMLHFLNSFFFFGNAAYPEFVFLFWKWKCCISRICFSFLEMEMLHFQNSFFFFGNVAIPEFNFLFFGNAAFPEFIFLFGNVDPATLVYFSGPSYSSVL